MLYILKATKNATYCITFLSYLHWTPLYIDDYNICFNIYIDKYILKIKVSFDICVN